MKKIILLVLFAAACGFAQAPAGKPSSPPAASGNARPELLPSKDLVDVALRRTLGYDPATSWVIYDITASPIPGVAEILVSLNKQEPVHIYWDTTTQTAIVGQLLPFGPSPFDSIRAKLQAADGPAMGAAKPSIVAIEFSDLECPHCKAAHPIIEKLVADFPQVRFIFQQFPLPANLHPWAMKAAQYADCVAKAKPEVFWKYVDTIFENQGGIALATADDQLKGFAAAVGLDADKIVSCTTSLETEARVKKSLDLGRSLDVNQTPTIFINGRRVLGVADIPYPQLKNLVQFEIDHAGK
ncbi:MAG TPA: thioredoxin domain-containing protein [Candidatus Angelobacter sp.]|nr:thioredoxin domain-containing protein [Candidatus Angelobacter sp.]